MPPKGGKAGAKGQSVNKEVLYALPKRPPMTTVPCVNRATFSCAIGRDYHAILHTQLGKVLFDRKHSFTNDDGSLKPGLVAGTVIDVAGGPSHMLLRTTSGEVFAMGNDEGGRLGPGIAAEAPSLATSQSNTPMPAIAVDETEEEKNETWVKPRKVGGLPIGTTVVRLACGSAFSVLLAESEGATTLFYCGMGLSAILGPDVPTEVTKLLPIPQLSHERVDSVWAGYRTCFARGSRGLFAFGDNTFGQLGAGAPGRELQLPTLIDLPRRVVQVACGQSHTLLVFDDGSVMAAGDNSLGALGVGADAVPTSTATFQRVPLPQPAVAVAAGSSHSVFLLSDGSVLVCGCGSFGQLGHGRLTSAVPVALAVDLNAALGNGSPAAPTPSLEEVASGSLSEYVNSKSQARPSDTCHAVLAGPYSTVCVTSKGWVSYGGSTASATTPPVAKAFGRTPMEERADAELLLRQEAALNVSQQPEATGKGDKRTPRQ